MCDAQIPSPGPAQPRRPARRTSGATPCNVYRISGLESKVRSPRFGCCAATPSIAMSRFRSCLAQARHQSRCSPMIFAYAYTKAGVGISAEYRHDDRRFTLGSRGAQRFASSSKLRSAHVSLNAVASGCARIHSSCAAHRRRMSSMSRRFSIQAVDSNAMVDSVSGQFVWRCVDNKGGLPGR